MSIDEASNEGNGNNADHGSKSNGNERRDDKRKGNFRSKQNFRDNIKFDPSVREESDDPEEIRKQVEFYFSESNIVQDKFLFNQIGGSKNLPIPISVIHSFKRMRRFQPLSAVVEALKESEVLEVVNGDEIKRKTPLSDTVGTNFDEIDLSIFEDEAMPRTLYAKGFGDETASTQYDIETFFQPYGPIKAVRLRRNNQLWFKGSVFVEFEDEETMKAFLDLDPKPKWNDNELKIMSKKAYCEMKVEDIKAGRIEANSRGQNGHRGRGGHRGGNRGGRGRDRGRDFGRDRRGNRPSRYRDNDDRGEDDWKGRRDDFQRRGYKDKRDGSGKAKDDKEGQEEQDYHDNGIPKVKATTAPSDKRSREEDNVEEPAAKKSKPEETTET